MKFNNYWTSNDLYKILRDKWEKSPEAEIEFILKLNELESSMNVINDSLHGHLKIEIGKIIAGVAYIYISLPSETFMYDIYNIENGRYSTAYYSEPKQIADIYKKYLECHYKKSMIKFIAINNCKRFGIQKFYISSNPNIDKIAPRLKRHPLCHFRLLGFDRKNIFRIKRNRQKYINACIQKNGL